MHINFTQSINLLLLHRMGDFISRCLKQENLSTLLLIIYIEIEKKEIN